MIHLKILVVHDNATSNEKEIKFSIEGKITICHNKTNSMIICDTICLIIFGIQVFITCCVISRKIYITPKVLTYHFEAALGFSRSEFTCL